MSQSDQSSPQRATASVSREPDVPAAEEGGRGSFLGFVAHEMRNPLSTALWSAELLARLSSADRGGARGEKLSGMCLRALQRLRLLLEDHFLAERLEVGGIPFRLEPVDVRDALQTAAGKAAVTQLTIEMQDDLFAWADRGLLERALEGLLAAAGRESPVHVTASRSGDAAVVKLRGAPPPPHAFEEPRKGTPSDPTGRALALLVAARVADALGGTLSTAGAEYLLAIPIPSAQVQGT